MLSIISRPTRSSTLDVRPLAYALARMAPELWAPADDDAARRDACRDILDDLLFEAADEIEAAA